MKTISTKQMLALKKSGSNVTILRAEPEKKAVKSKGPTVEQSLLALNDSVKKLASRKDMTTDIMKSVENVARILSVTIDKLKEVKEPEKTKIWDIEVLRDDDQLIKSLQLRSK